MGVKKVSFSLCLLLIFLFCSSCSLNFQQLKSDRYTKRLLKYLDSEEVFQVRDVFDFDFDRAYVIKDNYVSGKTFAEEYHLDISIEKVGKTDSEIQRRIVFVDEEGKYVFEYQYSAEILFAKAEGFVIYPETRMRRTENPLYWDIVTFEFLDVSATDYYGFPFDENISNLFTETLLCKLKSDESFQVKDVFDFEFDRAYVIGDPYISGKTFVEKYHLNLSINQVEKTSSKTQKRIVFVDKDGNYIFCYQYSSEELIPKAEGFVIYPETEMKRTESPLVWDSVSFEFVNIEESDYIGAGNTNHSPGISEGDFFSEQIDGNPIDKSYEEELKMLENISPDFQKRYIDIWVDELEFSVETLSERLSEADREKLISLQEKWEAETEELFDFEKSILINESYGMKPYSSLNFLFLSARRECYRDRTIRIKYWIYCFDVADSGLYDPPVLFFYDGKQD